MKKYIVTEGVESTWYYHISEENSPTKSLCGKWVMRTNCRMDSWGFVSPHIGERYCAECRKLMTKESDKD